MSEAPMVIDCDGHILEPPDLWETYWKRQCYLSADPDERTIAALMPLVGENVARAYTLD